MSQQRESHGTGGVKRSHGRAPEVMAESVNIKGIPSYTRPWKRFQQKLRIKQINSTRMTNTTQIVALVVLPARSAPQSPQ